MNSLLLTDSLLHKKMKKSTMSKFSNAFKTICVLINLNNDLKMRN